MNAPVTRRALLGATAAVGAVGLPNIVLASHADLDAELYALLDRFAAARAAWDATDAPLDEAMRRAVTAYPPRPDALRSGFGDQRFDLGGSSGRDRKPDGRWVIFYTETDVARMRDAPPMLRWAAVGDDVDPPPKEPDPEGEARRREIVDAHDAWQAGRRAVEDAVGFTAAAEAEDVAGAAWSEIDEAVKLYQPRTLAGLTRKAEWVAVRLACGGCDDDLGEVFARQVAAFGGVIL